MPRSRSYWAALLVLLAGTAHAQPTARVRADAPRVLGQHADRVKTDDGQMAERLSTITYDPAAGVYRLTVRDSSGRVIRQRERATMMVGPSPDEAAAADALIRADPEIAALIADAEHPVTVSGGFPLVREAGHACGPGARCLMYDVFETAPPPAKGERPASRRLRFVVVDLRAVRVLDTDFDAARDGNFANPDIRARSRARQ